MHNSVSVFPPESFSIAKCISQTPGRATDRQNVIKPQKKTWHQGLAECPCRTMLWSHISSSKASMMMQGKDDGSTVLSTSWTLILCTLSFTYFFYFIRADLTNINFIHWKYTTWHFDICIYREMIATFKLVNISISSQLFCGYINVCLCVWERECLSSILLANFKHTIKYC